MKRFTSINKCQKEVVRKLTGTTLISLIVSLAFGQSDSLTRQDTSDDLVKKDAFPIVMRAGEQYKASGWKTLWWGKHYRREWATPVSFPVLDMENFAGGLMPIKIGGGHESKSLRVLGSNGKEYVMRTMDKSLNSLVPDDFKGTFLNDVVNDQISTAHPYGPIAVAKMASSLSFMHANPVIYYVPDDSRLGEFAEIFANKLCLVEERPSGKGWEHSDLFGNADDIVNTEKMLDIVFESSKNAVDQNSFLRVRFFDMIINDWDRHEDQWVWAEKKINEHRLYFPIARDRDQSFSKTDGFNLFWISQPWALRPLENMDRHVRDIRGANFSAANLDQQFLNGLTIEDWKQNIQFIQKHLTDSVIKDAIYTMPAEVNKISGDFLVRRLIERRDNLMRDGMHYYSMLAKQVTINGSADNEQFIIDQEKENEVTVTGLRAENDTFYHRVFNRHETKAISIYGLDGDDQYIVKGNAKNHFIIRLIGGEGKNQYVAGSSSRGKSYKIYDSLHHEGFSRKTFWVNRHWDTLYRYNRVSVKYDWYLPLILPSYNPDDELSISAGLIYKKQRWGKTPYAWQQLLLVNYSTGTSSVGFNYKGLFKQSLGKWDIDLAAYYKGPRYTMNYYGLGNETELNGKERSFFKVKANDLYVSPGVSRAWKSSHLRLGLQYQIVEILTSQDRFVTSPGAKLDPSVFSSINYAGVNGEWTVSNAGDERYRTKGVDFTSGFSYLHNLDNTDRKILRINAEASIYHTFFNWLTFSHRTGAATIFGDYEFYQANTLGGSENLRGYWRSRFAGKSNFYQNTELRISFGNLKGYVFRGKIGVFGFFDDGRVWLKDDNSSELHTGYGGGIFFLPYNRAALTVSYAVSRDANVVAVRAGFLF
jgi:hypothetical protein